MARDVFYQDMYQYNFTAVFSQANDCEQSFVQYTFLSPHATEFQEWEWA
jgi:hypothetical protein